MAASGDSPTVDLANLATVMLTRIPETGAWFDSFVEPGVPRDFGWDDVDFDAYQFVMEVFTDPVFIPAVRQAPGAPELLDRCASLVEAMVTSSSDLVRDVVWFDVLEPLLADVRLIRDFRPVAGPETSRELAKLIQAHGVTGID
ncbi:hypothetical protein [Streptacidiphilus sp. P02-A3a]|uniref:hypothetical protein n=1 Tax=Streptacidiphilus sp. P02-A3a TaxID=2704468 RepID=UPI0015F8B962|nr:hypothetical protein [Streptacidiphilus sp. P02-A3a]QMU72436.1 hypothetical protein GXP74_33510 [Streptacidiphilus sp. P02-A3a]